MEVIGFTLLFLIVGYIAYKATRPATDDMTNPEGLAETVKAVEEIVAKSEGPAIQEIKANMQAMHEEAFVKAMVEVATKVETAVVEEVKAEVAKVEEKIEAVVEEVKAEAAKVEEKVEAVVETVAEEVEEVVKKPKRGKKTK